MKPVFVTSNSNKVEEAEKILGSDLERSYVELDEIQAVEIEEVVKKKVTEAYEKIGQPVIVTDTGVYISDLNGFPGALIKWMYERIGNEGIADIAGGSKAEAATVIGYHDGDDIQTFRGSVKGMIAEEPKGENGFGWDYIFVPEGDRRTFAEMTKEEKNEMSMRKRAFEKMEEGFGAENL